MKEIKLWVCEDCGEIRSRTVDFEDDEPDLPNHHSTWIPYIATPALIDGSECGS